MQSRAVRANMGTFLPPLDVGIRGPISPQEAKRRPEPVPAFSAVGPWPQAPRLQTTCPAVHLPVLPNLIDFLPGHPTRKRTHTVCANNPVGVSAPQAGDSCLVNPKPFISSPQKQPPKPKRKRIRIKTERRREQCRANQERYRNKQRRHEDQLKDSVCNLRADIKILEMQRHCLLRGIKDRHAFTTLVAKYAELFEHGLQVTERVWSCPNSPQEILKVSEAQQKLVFLRTTMTTDVVIGELQGIDALVDQWQRYSTYFDDLQMRMESMSEGSASVLFSFFTMRATITKTTLQQVFPHLLGTSDSNECSSIAGRLVGQRLECQSSLVVHWDEESNRISRLSFTPDLFTALMSLLNNVEDAVYVLQEARLTPDAHIGEIES